MKKLNSPRQFPPFPRQYTAFFFLANKKYIEHYDIGYRELMLTFTM